MKRHVEEKELPYFAATLTAYLRESHPELLPDKHFIAERSDHAAQTYERAVRNGNSVYEALELILSQNIIKLQTTDNQV